MKNILVIANPDEGPQIALAKAQALAATTVASIHIVVFCYESLAFTQTEDEKREIKTMILSRAQQKWENYLHLHHKSTPINFEIVWEKDLVGWVSRHCESRHYDLIVKSLVHDDKIFHTPVDWQLLRESTLPVYCVNQHDGNKDKKKKHSNKHILVALDLVTDNKEKQDLNLRLLEAAFQLSVQTNSALQVCCAIKIPTLLKDMDLIDVPKRAASIKAEIIEKAEKLCDVYDIATEAMIIEQGEPWKVIVNAVRKKRSTCIVIGSIGRKGLQGKLMGNTAEKVIRYVDSDLLVLSPV